MSLGCFSALCELGGVCSRQTALWWHLLENGRRPWWLRERSRSERDLHAVCPSAEHPGTHMVSRYGFHNWRLECPIWNNRILSFVTYDWIVHAGLWQTHGRWASWPESSLLWPCILSSRKWVKAWTPHRLWPRKWSHPQSEAPLWVVASQGMLQLQLGQSVWMEKLLNKLTLTCCKGILGLISL